MLILKKQYGRFQNQIQLYTGRRREWLGFWLKQRFWERKNSKKFKLYLPEFLDKIVERLDLLMEWGQSRLRFKQRAHYPQNKPVLNASKKLRLSTKQELIQKTTRNGTSKHVERMEIQQEREKSYYKRKLQLKDFFLVL